MEGVNELAIVDDLAVCILEQEDKAYAEIIPGLQSAQTSDALEQLSRQERAQRHLEGYMHGMVRHIFASGNTALADIVQKAYQVRIELSQEASKTKKQVLDLDTSVYKT